MKKKLKLLKQSIAICCVAILLVVFGVLSVACKQDLLTLYKDNISELRTELYVYNDEYIDITISSGKKEKNFFIDGKSSGMEDFCIITIIPVAGINSDIIYRYSATYDQKNYSGELSRHPFNENYSTDIGVQTNGKDIELHIESDKGYKNDFKLSTQRTADMIDTNTALSIAFDRLKDRINKLIVDKKLNAEIYLRFINNPLNALGGYYWYVAIVDTVGNTYAVLIDPINEKILAVRE